MQHQAMRNGEFCGDNGGKFITQWFSKEERTSYHRRTEIDYDGRSVQWVKSSEISWIAVKVNDPIYIVSCGKLQVQEMPDFSEIFWKGLTLPSAIVSTGEVLDGSDFEVSFAEYKEKAAINFLERILWGGTSMCHEVETAISALEHLCRGNFKRHEIEIYYVDKDNEIKSLSHNTAEGLKSENIGGSQEANACGQESEGESDDARMTSALDPSVTCRSRIIRGSQGTSVCGPESESESDSESGSDDSMSPDDMSHERSSTSQNRETQIWHGGWDCRLSKIAGFSWICVQGKDSICVVTQEDMLGKERLEEMLENAPSHMNDNQVFGKKAFFRKMSKKSFVMRPSAAVSVVVGFDEASSAETNAIGFLMKKINKSSDFTFAGTVQTAISALLILTEKDLYPEQIKACVWRTGECLPAKSTKLGTKEIGDHLRVIDSQALLTQVKNLRKI